MAIHPNSTFGNYQIGEVIGEGGMGQVYRATDTTLDRQVAIKVLPDTFAQDADRVARFDREAKTLASLNHPNIAQIHGLETIDGTTAIIMELVDGPTLADRIAAGPIGAEEALRIARQIIDGLEAAHDRGIVHRDLKPANIKIKEDGLVKILDFGIAKPIDVMGSSGRGHSPTMVTPAVTESGVIMGTAAYMSPEQARGRFVDQRTDIWAFGCVLYEMLTGQPAFGGEDVMITLARILDRDADLQSIPGMVSPAVRHTIKMCLRKDPKKRIGHISDVRLALAGEFESDLLTGGKAAQPFWKKALPVAAATIVTAVVSVYATLLATREPEQQAAVAEVRRSALTLPGNQALNFPILPAVSISNDDSRMVYGASGALYIRDMDELEARIVPGTENETPVVPNFSPNGNWIAYNAGTNGSLKRVSVEGGTPLPIVPFVPSNGYTWMDDNTILYGNENEIWKVTASGGSPELIATDEPGYDMIEPNWIPGTDLILFARRSPDQSVSEVAIANMTNGEITTLFPGYTPKWQKEGYLIYFENTLGLMARRFDPATLKYGSGIVMVSDVLRQLRNGGGPQYRFSDKGSLIYVKGVVSDTQGAVMIALANEEEVTRQLGAPTRGYQFPSVSPDGSQVAVEDNGQVYVYRMDGRSEIRQLTFQGVNVTPTWSPDGQYITYSSDRDGTRRIWQQRADGSGVAEALTEGIADQPQTQPAWAPDGRLVYTTPNEGGANNIWIVSLPLGEPEILIGGPGNKSAVVFSPDGNAMAYNTGGGGNQNENQVFVSPFPPDGSSTRVSVAATPSGWPVWNSQGNKLFYMTGDAGGSFSAVDITLPGFSITNRRTLPYFALPNARRMASVPGTDDMLFTMPPQNSDGVGDATQLIFVENWIEEVKQRVPQDL